MLPQDPRRGGLGVVAWKGGGVDLTESLVWKLENMDERIVCIQETGSDGMKHGVLREQTKYPVYEKRTN